MVRAFSFLLASTLLAGCVQPGAGPATRAGNAVGAFPATGPTSAKVAVLLPLTGQNAGLGRDLLRAVQLALGTDGPQLDVQDTGGTPTGATIAAQAAVRGQDSVIVGPLTGPETAAAAAAANGIPILAFTSDQQQGRPGVWALGITPQQQAARLIQALSQAGRTNVAAVLPDNSFGNALSDGLTRAAATSGVLPPVIKRYPTGRTTALDSALKDVTDYTNRNTLANPASSDQPDPAAPPTPASPQAPLGPPPFNALLLAESGPGLQAAAAALQRYQAGSPAVQIVGPATWARDAASLGGLSGAWYAAPDPATRGAFETVYGAAYGGPPPSFASIAYDAARLAKVAASSPASLTQPGGFRGADGPIALRPDGRVERGLAVFAVERDGPRLVEPVPATLPGS